MPKYKLPNYRDAFRDVFKLPRPTVRETALFAAIYLLQAMVCVLVINEAYRRRAWLGESWAVVSAVLTLQPGIAQSLVTSVVRILANTVGALLGFVVGHYLGVGEWQLLVALTSVVVVCEVLHLDLALRTACVSVVIVLTANRGAVQTTSLERFRAVLIGCSTALLIQVITDFVRSEFFASSTPSPAVLAAAAAEPGKRVDGGE